MTILNKKGQGLFINVIIIAAIALAVLVILFAIFTGRLGGFNKGLDTCSNLGGACSDGCDPSTERQYTAGRTSCESDDDPGAELCCIPIPGAT